MLWDSFDDLNKPNFDNLFDFTKCNSTRANHPYKLYVKPAKCNAYKYSFFTRIVQDCNSLRGSIVETGSLSCFKVHWSAVMKKLKFWTNRQYICTQCNAINTQGVQIEGMTLHSWSYQRFFFLFSNWLDSYYNNVRRNEVIKILPSQLQRVNMSLGNFFQLDLHAVFVIKVGPHNAMFYDVVRRQCDWLLCSVPVIKG